MEEELCERNTPWNVGKHNGTVNRKALKSKAKLWCKFLNQTLMLTTHSNRVDCKRLALTSPIFNMCYINIDHLIVERIYTRAKSRQGHFFYPCLITELCHRAGVPVLPEDIITPIRQGWNRAKILELMTVMRAIPKSYAEPEAAEFDGPATVDRAA